MTTTDIRPRVTRRRAFSFGSCLLLIGSLFALLAPAQASSVAAPTGLRAAYVAPQGVGLTWNVTAQDAYRVRFAENSKMTGGDTWDVVGNYFEWTEVDAHPMVNSPRLKPGKTYYFQVRAISRNPAHKNRVNLSGYSKAIAVKTPDNKYLELEPTQIKATPAGDDSMYISWNSRGPGHKYLVRYTDNPNLPVLQWQSTKFDVAGGVITGLKPDTRYYFRPRVITDEGGPLSLYSEAVSRSTLAKTTSPRLTVISYNVLKANSTPNWAARRQAVAQNILDREPDVLGLQEATPVKVTGSKGTQVNQYDDLMDLLGDKYTLATRRGSSGSKLAYNTERLTVIASDAQALTTLGSATRYAVWATFEDKISKKRFFVINTHLEPGSSTSAANNNARIKQAEEILALIKQHSAGLPVMITGDMNSNRASTPNNGQYRTFTAANFVDIVDNELASWESSRSANTEHLIDIEYSSYNGLEKKVRRTAFPVGTFIDYIYATPAIRVGMWRNVVDVDRNGNFRGTIPSDHNMFWASIHLP